MIQNRRTIGSDTETIALTHLQTLGYSLLERNSYIKHNEIDLILRDKDFIVFVEVKSIKKDSYISIYETLSKKKKRFIKYSINKWLLKNNLLMEPWRFDFVGIVVDNDSNEIEHFKFVEL